MARLLGFVSSLRLFTALAAFLLIPIAYAQILNDTTSQTTPSPGDGHDYLHMLGETVNPADGSVSFRLNVPIPKGRGLTLPFAWVYNSSAAFLQPVGPNLWGWGYDRYNTNYSAGSWATNLPVLSVVRVQYTAPGMPPPVTCYAATNYVFNDPQGGTHPLGLASVLNPGAQSCSGVSWTSQLMGGDDFVQATLNPGGLFGNPPNPAVGTVAVVDSQGSVYNFNGGVTWGTLGSGDPNDTTAQGMPRTIEDRNGNIVQLFPSGSNSIVDSTGRTELSFSQGSQYVSFLFGNLTVSGMSNSYNITITPVSGSGVALHQVLVDGNSQPCDGGQVMQNFTAGGYMPSAIKLPNQQAYQFSYDSAFGLISKITYPNDGYIQYSWQLNPLSSAFGYAGTTGYPNSCIDQYDRPALKTRIVSFDGTTKALEQDFSYSTSWSTGNPWFWLSKQTTVVTKDLLAGTSFTTVYTYGACSEAYGPGCAVAPAIPDTIPPQGESVVIAQQIPTENTVTYKDSSGKVLKTVQKGWGGLEGDELGYELTTLDDGSISSICYGWGPGHTITDKQEFNYGSGVSGSSPCPKSITPIRDTKTTYQSFATTPIYPGAPSILDRPASVSTYGNGTLAAQTLYSYDQTTVTGVSNLPTGTHDEPNYGTSVNPPRGNATTVTRKCLTCTDSITTYTFDETGQTLSMVDPNGNTTSYSYADSYTDAHPTISTNTYLTQITYPTTGSISHIESFSYAYSDGQLTISKDQNQLQTNYSYDDSLRRITETDYPDGGQLLESYSDTPPTPSVTSSKKINSSQTLTTVAVMDGLGHVTETQLTSDPQGTIYKDTVYNGMNLVSSVSNPYRKGSDPTTSAGTTTYSYDALSRKIQEAYPDGSILTTAYCGPSTLVTDPTGRWRRSGTDAMGRVVEVDEPNAPGAQVASTGCPGTGEPIWVTSYTYDGLNDLTNILQNGSHQRIFTFDSLRRMLTSFNPETGQITYTYDPNSNVLTKKDSRSIKTTNRYDALNRVISTSYSNGDPSITTSYDQSTCLNLPSCSNIGHRTHISDGAGSESFAYQVDQANLRDIHREKRTTNSAPNNITLTTTYYSDLAGNLTSIGYPTGRTINYTYDTASRPITATDSSNGITYVSAPQSPLSGCRASAVCYTPQDSIYSGSIGQSSSFTGLNIAGTYNSRLQPLELKASSAGGNAMDITYSFVDPASLGNAGHVTNVTSNLDSTRSQGFAYDQVNRLLEAGTVVNTGSHCWGYLYTYDAWGNLLSQAGWTQYYSGCTETTMAAVTANGNNQISGLTYDASGNTQSDSNNTYTWDAESQLKTAAGVTYAYDGDGRRVAKIGSKLYWYGSGGEILAETDAAGNTQNEYIFFSGKRMAVLPAGSNPLYYAEDFLGSSRVIVQSNGTLCYDADFTPFGGERAYTNTCPQNYKFEGKERDTETQNDNFDARYYSWRFGRWLSSDWSSIPTPVPYANFTNPQTLNLYSMVADDPESFADLDGHGPPFPGFWAFGNQSLACVQEYGPSSWACATRTDVGIANAGSQGQVEAATQQSGAQNRSSAAAAPALPLAACASGGCEAAATGAGAAALVVLPAAAMAAAIVLPVMEQGDPMTPGYVPAPPVTGTPASTSQQGAVDTSPMAAHSTGGRESTRQEHEEGEARAARDRGGEKGDKAGTYPRKPPRGWKTGETGNKSGKWPPTNPRDQRIADGLMGR